MMFEDEDCQALQTLINNHTISPEAQQTPFLALKAIQSIIKEDVHFGTIGMSCCQICTSSLMKVSTHYPLASSPSLVSASSHHER